MTDDNEDLIEVRLRERSDELRQTRRGPRTASQGMVSGELSQLDIHLVDGGTATHEQELDLSTEVLMAEEERRLAEVRALEQGTYGACVECARPIARERLVAVPEAVRCIACQRSFEAEHGQANRHGDGP